MKLVTSIAPRKDGTVVVTIGERDYVFAGAPLACDVEDAKDAEHLRALGFMTPDEHETEQRFLRQAEERQQRLERAAVKDEDGDEDDAPAQPARRGRKPAQ